MVIAVHYRVTRGVAGTDRQKSLTGTGGAARMHIRAEMPLALVSRKHTPCSPQSAGIWRDMMSKRKKVKLPKRIAGVKLPKATRKGPIVDFLNSSGGQVLLAEALVLAAGVFGARRVAAQAGAPWDPGTRENIARENIADASARLAHASREALKAFRAALSEPSPLLDEISDTDDTSSEESAGFVRAEEVAVAKKKRATSRAGTEAAMP